MDYNGDSDDGPVIMQTQQNATYQDMTVCNKLTVAEKEALMSQMSAFSNIFSVKPCAAKVDSHSIELAIDTQVRVKP